MTYEVVSGDARNADPYPEEASVDLVVTSPPYNVGVDYDEYDDDRPTDEWRDLLRTVFNRCFVALKDGGRMAINIAIGPGVPCPDKPEQVKAIARDVGFRLRDKYVWHKGPSEASSAWGSWRSPSNPKTIYDHEEILVFYKTHPDRKDRSGETLSKRDFMDSIKSTWLIPYTPEERDLAHPAPYPKEIPRRLIKLYSFPDDVVLDPFAGSGTTLVAALQCNREAVGIEYSDAYADLARSRCDDVAAQMPVDDFF